jgi:hypothetical protein
LRASQDADYDDAVEEILAGKPFMATNERSSLSCLRWAEGISGDALKEAHWRAIFDDHVEFFRKSPDDVDHYALIWRRALPRRFFRPDARMLTQSEVDALPPDQRSWVSRPPVPEAQINTLVNIAITLHAHELDQSRDWRWWIPIVAVLAGTILGALIGASL